MSKRNLPMLPNLDLPAWDSLQPDPQAAHQTVSCRHFPKSFWLRAGQKFLPKQGKKTFLPESTIFQIPSA
jgi:hypothetical protein